MSPCFSPPKLYYLPPPLAEGEAEDASQEMDEDVEFDDSPVIPKLKTYKEAINSLEDVCQSLEHKGH